MTRIEDMLSSLRELYSDDEIEILTSYDFNKISDLYYYSKEQEVEIKDLEMMLGDNVFINSPDGYQKINFLVKKGYHKGAIVKVKDKTIVTTYDHLFDLERGWTYAKDIVYGDKVLFEDGKYYPISVELTDEEYNIYDMEVDHENHRYYADGISSHNTGVGKTISLVALACNMVREGEDVLYVTLEMAEEKITQRAEANFLDVFINDVKKIEADSFKKSLLNIKNKNVGRLLVKEFPTATINVEHIRGLLDELEIKKNFKPTVLIVDYINLMKSSRFNGDSMYSIVKSICEELRGLAVENELCIISATQANKDGNNSKMTDLDLTNVGESKALADTVDFLAALIYPEELREQQIQIWKVLKNRFGGSVNYRFPIRTEHEKCQIHDGDDMDLVDNETKLGNEIKNKNKKEPKKKINMKISNDDLEDDLF